jgi:hypothetical protein
MNPEERAGSNRHKHPQHLTRSVRDAGVCFLELWTPSRQWLYPPLAGEVLPGEK